MVQYSTYSIWMQAYSFYCKAVRHDEQQQQVLDLLKRTLTQPSQQPQQQRRAEATRSPALLLLSLSPSLSLSLSLCCLSLSLSLCCWSGSALCSAGRAKKITKALTTHHLFKLDFCRTLLIIFINLEPLPWKKYLQTTAIFTVNRRPMICLTFCQSAILLLYLSGRRIVLHYETVSK